MIKLIASDMDGTLLDGNGGISPYNVEMINEAKKRGIHFVIASGRAYTDILPVTQQHGVECACVTGNGAEYIDEKGELISSCYLGAKEAIGVIEILKALDIKFMIYTTDNRYSIEAVENVQDAYDLVKACERIKSVNLGGSKIEENRRKLDTAFYVDDNDCRLLGELLDHGIELEIRQVPEEKKKIVTKDMLS